MIGKVSKNWEQSGLICVVGWDFGPVANTQEGHLFYDFNILYLDDEPLVAFDTGDHLKTLRFAEVVVTYRLDQAEDAVCNTRFDIALLDINVDRGQTSVALGEALAAQGCKVIFASGLSEAAAEFRARGFDFLDKPFALPVLTERLKALVQPHPETLTRHSAAAAG